MYKAKSIDIRVCVQRVCVCEWVCVHMCVCEWVCVHMCVCVCTYVCVCEWVCVYICVCVRVGGCVCVCVHYNHTVRSKTHPSQRHHTNGHAAIFNVYAIRLTTCPNTLQPPPPSPSPARDSSLSPRHTRIHSIAPPFPLSKTH